MHYLIYIWFLRIRKIATIIELVFYQIKFLYLNSININSWILYNYRFLRWYFLQVFTQGLTTVYVFTWYPNDLFSSKGNVWLVKSFFCLSQYFPLEDKTYEKYFSKSKTKLCHCFQTSCFDWRTRTLQLDVKKIHPMSVLLKVNT